MKKILLIGPLPDPITGLSMANQTVVDGVTKYTENYKVNHINTSYHKLEKLGSFSFAKLFFYSSHYLQLLKVVVNDYIYITPGQTFFGVVKYALFIFLAKIFRKQVIIHIHGNYLHQEYDSVSGWKKKIMHLVLSRSDKGIVLSDSLDKNLTPFISSDTIYSLYNFVEDSLLPKKEEETELHTDHLRILYLSNLIPAKGIFDFLDALLILQEKGIKFTAQIAGAIDPENEEKIQNTLDELADNVEYLGIVRGDSKKQVFLNSNVFIFPTYYSMEGQPIAILEAMATGNVILTTRHAGIPDIFIDPENGYYVKKHDAKDIAEKLIEISKNLSEKKDLMLINQKTAVERYSVEKFISNFIDIIEK